MQRHTSSISFKKMHNKTLQLSNKTRVYCNKSLLYATNTYFCSGSIIFCFPKKLKDATNHFVLSVYSRTIIFYYERLFDDKWTRWHFDILHKYYGLDKYALGSFRCQTPSPLTEMLHLYTNNSYNIINFNICYTLY